MNDAFVPAGPQDADMASALRLLLDRFEGGGDAGLSAALMLEDRTAWLAQPRTIVGALCLGGAAFASRLVAHLDDTLAPVECHAVVLDAFCSLVDPPQGAAEGHELRLAQELIEAFGLPAKAAALLDLVRAEFLIAAGPLEEMPEAVLACMRHERWALSLRGLIRLHDELQEGTPLNAYGLAAMCLHKLGRYSEAEDWTAAGLGAQQALLAIPPVRTEAELVQLWQGRLSPVVSILCTTYNHERYIESALRGFLSQDCSHPFEILIHDDASTDATQQTIRSWQLRYPNVIKPLLQTENQYSKGVRPFELLLARARGEFVATCEGDDYWIHPAKLQRQVDFLKANPAFSCSAHNYRHFVETALQVRPWTELGRDFVLSERQMMGVHFLVWFPTLVFRRTFSALPPERDRAAFGDQFLTSLLGTHGRCMYFETLLGAVRRENEFSAWSPLSQADKERRRVQTWAAIASMHRRLGNHDAAEDLMARIGLSTLDGAVKARIVSVAMASSPVPLPGLVQEGA